MLIDSHCHLDFPELAGRLDEILALMRDNQVTRALCVSVNLDDFPKVLALAEAHAHLYASVGVHPDYPDVTEPSVAELVRLAAHPKIVAIGETGLDYYRLTGDLEWQRERFRTHIRAAKQCGKPLIIHTRSAADDTLRLMREEGANQASGVMHCFTESWEVAEAAPNRQPPRDLSRVLAEHADGSAVGREHRRDDPQQRGLAGAVRTEQPGDAAPERNAHAVDGASRAVGLRHLGQFDGTGDHDVLPISMRSNESRRTATTAPARSVSASRAAWPAGRNAA